MDKATVSTICSEQDYEALLGLGEVRLVVWIAADGLTVLLRGSDVGDWDLEVLAERMPRFDDYVLVGVSFWHGFPAATYYRTSCAAFDPLRVERMSGTFMGQRAEYKFVGHIGVGPTLCDW